MVNPVLILASITGKLDILNAMIIANASINIQDISGKPALMIGKYFLLDQFIYLHFFY